MKKISILFAGLLAGCMSLGAQTIIPSPGNDSGAPMPHRQAPAKAAEDNSNQLIFGYCNPLIATSFGLQPGYDMRLLITIPAEVTETWVGNKISKIRIGLADGTLISSAYGIITTPEEDGRPNPNCLRRQRASVRGGWNEITLTDPLPITGEPLWVGYEITTVNSSDYPVGCDYIYPENEYSDHVGIYSPMDDGTYAWVWQRVGAQFGSLCIQVVVEGDALPQNDVKLSNLIVPDYNKVNEPFDISVLVANNGVSEVKNLTFECKVNNEDVKVEDYVMTPASINPGESATVELKGLKYGNEGANLPIEVTATRVNDEMDATPLNNKIAASTSFSEIVFPRAFVVEEWTGTWCPWCVRGIVGMEYMREKYHDKGFIGIAVHAQDQMASSSYSGFITKFASTYPGATLNRTFTFDPNIDNFEILFNAYGNRSTIYGISGKAVYDPDNKQINVDTEFTSGTDLRDVTLGIAVAIIEDQVGPYMQQNAFAGGGNGPMGGWENKGGNVYWSFDEVAREISKWNGTASAIPRNVMKNEPVEYSLGVSTRNVTKIENATAVAMVLNTISGEVLNACLLPIESEEAAVESVNAAELGVEIQGNTVRLISDCLSATIYSIDGKNVCNLSGNGAVTLPSGLYIVRVANGSTVVDTYKILVK